MKILLVLGCAACLAASPPALAAPAAKTSASGLGAPALAASLARLDRLPAPMGHPRLFKGQDDFAGIVAAARAERANSVKALADTLRRHPVRNIAPGLKAHIESADKGRRMASWWQQDRLLEGMAEAAFAWYVTRDGWLLEETRARMRLFGRAVLERNCRGDISETRDYVWYFALAYDFAYPALKEEERELVRELIDTCANGALSAVPSTFRSQSDNGIAFNAMGKLVGALLIVRGDFAGADRLLASALPAYVSGLSPWGGPDGGFANGSSYALWDAGESMLAWDLIERVLGVPLYRKPWLAQLARFVAYTLPPGTPAGAFGDGAEVARSEEWARLGKAIAHRSATPLSRWYARQLKGDDHARLHILLSPRQQGAPAALGATPDGASFPSVGVVAMHSALDDPQRVSVLFKSSPFGSLNHSHADQNSFVLYARGKVLAMDSGSYDSYNSPHWRNWYKQTRAHNAITFDGGQGQWLGALGLGSRASAGRIVRFTHSPAVDIAVGEAARAYGPTVRMARRSMVFVRPATLVVVDQLRSATARSWEWNLHTMAPLTGQASSFKLDVDGVQMCGTLAAPVPIELSSKTGYQPPPARAIGPHHWHRFALRAPRKDALFVAVLRVGCTGAAPAIGLGAQGAVVTAGGRTIRVGSGGVTVAP